MAKEGARKEVFRTTKVFAVPPVFALKHAWADISGTQYFRSTNSYVNIHESFILELDQALVEDVT